MAAVDLSVALALIGVGWAVLTLGLRRSVRGQDVTQLAEGHLTAKAARWRRPPDNRTADKFAHSHEGGRV